MCVTHAHKLTPRWKRSLDREAHAKFHIENWTEAKTRSQKSVKIYPVKGTLTEGRADEIIRSFGGRPMTKEESREFRRFIKDPYP